MAYGGGVVRLFGVLVVGSWWATFALAGCPSTPAPVAPLPDADAACVVDQRITDARLIRTADGSPLAIPCEAGR